MSLKEPNLKMSKSHSDPRSRILLTDSSEEICKKIKVALTDSEAGVTYDPIGRPGVSNLLELLSHFDGRTCEDLVSEHRFSSLRALKETLANQISSKLAPIRERYLQLIADKGGYLDAVAEQGKHTARTNAQQTMSHVRNVMGL